MKIDKLWEECPRRKERGIELLKLKTTTNLTLEERGVVE